MWLNKGIKGGSTRGIYGGGTFTNHNTLLRDQPGVAWTKYGTFFFFFEDLLFGNPLGKPLPLHYGVSFL